MRLVPNDLFCYNSLPIINPAEYVETNLVQLLVYVLKAEFCYLNKIRLINAEGKASILQFPDFFCKKGIIYILVLTRKVFKMDFKEHIKLLALIKLKDRMQNSYCKIFEILSTDREDDINVSF
jgi:hypothetical protein